MVHSGKYLKHTYTWLPCSSACSAARLRNVNIIVLSRGSHMNETYVTYMFLNWILLALAPGLQVDVAHGRQAYQSSTYGPDTASMAVDGDYSTESCTLADISSWWSVDLGQLTNVAGVNVTNDKNTNFGRTLVSHANSILLPASVASLTPNC